MDNKKIDKGKTAVQQSDAHSNWFNCVSDSLAINEIRINHELAKKFERLNAGVSE